MTYTNLSLVQLASIAADESIQAVISQSKYNKESVASEQVDTEKSNIRNLILEGLENFSSEERISDSMTRFNKLLAEVGETEWFENFCRPYREMWKGLILKNWEAKIKNIRNGGVIVVR